MDKEIELFGRDICNLIVIVETLRGELNVLKKRHFYRYHRNRHRDKINTHLKKKCLKMNRKKSENPVVVEF